MKKFSMPSLPLFDKQPIVPVAVKELRKYQNACIERARNYFVAGKKRILLVAPCGAGKMVILAHVIRTSTVPVLFVAHRMELIDQCARELAALGVSRIGVMRADDERTDPTATIQIASAMTLARRRLPDAGIVIVDEAHRAMGDTYQNILNNYPGAVVLGFTATPTRLDGKPLGQSFDVLDVVATYSELIKAGYITEPDCWSSPVQPDLSGVRTRQGDYEEGALAEVMKPLTGKVVDHWLERAHMHQKPGVAQYESGERRRTVVFAVNIAHAKMLLERFRDAGVRAEHLDGETPEDERRGILARLASGETELVTNVNVLLEGTDVPAIKCVVHARPTQSLVLYMQGVGRMLRPWNGVKPLLLDHAGNFDRHGAPHEDRTWSLERGAVRASHAKYKLCKFCFAYCPSGATVCPHCGTEFPRAPVKPVVETGAHLQQRDTTPEGLRRAFYDALVHKARERGFKPGYPAALYKEKYGAWPPWAWSEATRSSFASDPFWQKALERKTKEREAWESKEKPKIPTSPYVPPLETFERDEDDFKDWLDGLN